MALKDLMEYGVEPTDEKKEEEARLEEIKQINWLEQVDKVKADDLLFSEPVAGEENPSRGVLNSYYSKSLGVESLDDEMLTQFIKEDFGDASEDDALASLKQTKTWGARDADPQQLGISKNITAGDWLRSFSGHTTKAVYGISGGGFTMMASLAKNTGNEGSEFYNLMLGAAEDVNRRGEEGYQVMRGDKFFSEEIGQKADEEMFAQNLGQLALIIPLGVVGGAVGLAGMAGVNMGMLHNEAFQMAKEEGQSDSEALDTASIYTMIAAPGETLVDMVTSGMASPFTKMASKLSGTTIKAVARTAIQTATAAGPGGLVEGGQYALLQKLTNQEISPVEFWATVRAGAILEGLGGGVTHAMGEVDTARAKVKLRKDFQPVFGDKTSEVVDRIFADDEPNRALNREVLTLIETDLEAIQLGEKKNSLLAARTARTKYEMKSEQIQAQISEEIVNQAWADHQAEANTRLGNAPPIETDVPVQTTEGHVSPEELTINGKPTRPQAAKTPEQIQAQKEQDFKRRQGKQRKARMLEMMEIDPDAQEQWLIDNPPPVELVPTEKTKEGIVPIQEENAPSNDPNDGRNLAVMVQAWVDTGLSEKEAQSRVVKSTTEERSRMLSVLNNVALEEIGRVTAPEDAEIQAIDDRLEEIGRLPKPVEQKFAFADGLKSENIRILKETMPEAEMRLRFDAGQQLEDLIAAVHVGDREAVRRFNERTQGRTSPPAPEMTQDTTYGQATRQTAKPKPVVGESVKLTKKIDGTAMVRPQNTVIESLSEDGTLAQVKGRKEPVLLSDLLRSDEAVSKQVSQKVAEKLKPQENKVVTDGAKRFRYLATQDFVADENMTVAEQLKARDAAFYEKLPALVEQLGVTAEELMFDAKQAELVPDLEVAPASPVEESVAEIAEAVAPQEAPTQEAGKLTPAQKEERTLAEAEAKEWAEQELAKLEAATPAEAVAVVKDEMTNPDNRRPAKEIKADIIDQLEKAIKDAPEYEQDGKVSPVGSPKFVEFDIPGDGSFKIENSRYEMEKMLAKAKSLKTAPTEKVSTASREGAGLTEKELTVLLTNSPDLIRQYKIQIENGVYSDAQVKRINSAIEKAEAKPSEEANALYQKKTKSEILQRQGLTEAEARQLLNTRTEKQTIQDIETSFGIPKDEAAAVVAIIQSMGLDVNNFAFNKKQVREGVKYIAKTQFVPALAKALISATKNANLETAVHEVSHVARRFLLTRGEASAVEEQLITDIEAAYGVKDTWTRRQEELFAEDFVQYIKTGEAPSAQTETLFQKMSNWIRKVTRLFGAQNRSIPKNMDVLFGELMTRGAISEDVKATIEERASRAEAEYNQAYEASQSGETPTGIVPESALPFNQLNPPAFTLTKAAVAEATGRIRGVIPESFAEWAEEARTRGYIDNALDIARGTLADPETPIGYHKEAALVLRGAMIEKSIEGLRARIANTEKLAETQSGYKGETTKLKDRLNQHKADLQLIREAAVISGTSAGRSLVAKKMGIGITDEGTLYIAKNVIRDINESRTKPLTAGEEASFEAMVNHANSLAEQIATSRIKVSMAEVEASILYMLKKSDPPLARYIASDLRVRIAKGLSADGMTGETAKNIRTLAIDMVANGATTLETITSSLMEQFKGLNEQDIWYAVGGRFVEPKKAITDLKRTEQRLTKESKLHSEVEDALKGVFEKVKVGEPITSDTIKTLQAGYRHLRSYYTQEEISSEQQKRILESIDEAQAQLEGLYRPLKDIQKTLDAETQGMKDRLSDIRGQIRDADATAAIDEAIATWSTPVSTKTRAEQSEARQATQAKLQEARSLLQMYMESKPGNEAKKIAKYIDRIKAVENEIEGQYRNLPAKKRVSPSETIQALQSQLSESTSARNIQDRILETKDMIRNFDKNEYIALIKDQKNNPSVVEESGRLQGLRKELAQARKTLNNKQERAKTHFAKYWMKEAFNVAKATLLAGDMPVLRQGGIVTANPFRAGFIDITMKSAKVYASGLVHGDFAQIMGQQLSESEYFQDSVNHGVIYVDSDAALNDGEMIVGANVAEKIPILGRLLTGSNQAQSIGTNLARYQAYASFKTKFPNASRAELESWAEWVNTATGRSVNEAVSRAATFTDYFLLSTRYMASRFEALAKPLQFNMRGQHRVAAEAWKDLAWFFGTRIAFVEMLKWVLGRDSVEMSANPLNHTFMKIQVHQENGMTRVYDPFAGIAQPLRLVVGTPTKFIANAMGADIENKPIDDALRFARGRISPFWSFIHGQASGENYFGEETPRGELAVRSFAPLPLQQVYDNIVESDDPFDIAVSSVMNVLGANDYYMKTSKLPHVGEKRRPTRPATRQQQRNTQTQQSGAFQKIR